MSTQTSTETGTEFTITRTFDAPLAKVWDVWTQAEHFQHWFHAVPGSVHLDVRPGGAWSAVLDTPYGEMPLGGVYRDVVHQEKLAWTLPTPDGEVVMSAVFAGHGATTDLRYSQNVVPSDNCENPSEGSTGILDSFEHYLGEIA